MGNYRLALAQRRFAFGLALLVFPFAVVVYLFSSCDVRRRGDKHACLAGNASRCLAVGQFYEARTDGLIATMLSNATTAKDYYHRACELGNDVGCARFGHMMLSSYDAIRDDGFTQADGTAALRKACDAGELDICRELADALEPAEAAPILQKLCDGGDPASCNKLVALYQQLDPKRAADLLAKRCDAGDNDQCRELGRALLAGGTYGDADLVRGAALLTKACERGAWGGCRELGEAVVDGTLPGDAARGRELLGSACDHADLDACYWFGKALIDIDPAKALATFTAECAHDDRGCDAAADLYRVGVPGIDRDRNRAYDLYSTACRSGSMYDCHKRDCLWKSDSDACYKFHHHDLPGRLFKLDERFDVK